MDGRSTLARDCAVVQGTRARVATRQVSVKQ